MTGPSIIAHPEHTDCVAVVATSTAHAWRIMAACDAAGFRAGYPSLVSPPTVAVSGRIADVAHVAKLADVVRTVSE